MRIIGRLWNRYRSWGRLTRQCLGIGLALAVVAASCLVRLGTLQLVDGKVMAQAATNSRTARVTVNASRGRILDANGIVLAQSVERYDIIADPQAVSTFVPVDCGTDKARRLGYCHSVGGHRVGATGAAAVARLLAPVLDMDAMKLGAAIDGTGRYALVARDVAPSVKRRIDDLHLVGCVYGRLSSERLYADGTLMGSLLGGTDEDGNGVAGVEAMENKALSGTDGYMVYQRGNGGEVIPGTVAESKDATDGSDVTLTLDSNVDWYVKKVLTEGKKEFGAAWAIAVVQDVRTGQILALEDSDEIQAGSPQAKLNASRAVSEVFEPGSTGKVVTLAGLLQSGVRTPTDRFTVPDTLTTKDGQKFRDSSPHGAEHWTMTGIVANSSNVGMVMASDGYSDRQRYENLRSFGFGETSGLDLPGESAGQLGTPETWDGRTRDTVLFGQGYSVNALQLTNAIATIADGGVRRQQSIVKSVTGPDGRTVDRTPGAATRVIDEKVAAQVRNAMEWVAEHYQGIAGVPGYRVAAKSGTAQVAGADGRLTSIVADYSGIIPADDPRFVVTVIMKDPEGTYGGMTSGKLFGRIGEFLMQKYDVPGSAPRTDAIPVDW